MNNNLSLYDILHPHIDFFDMVETCEDIISKEESYGFIVRPGYVWNIRNISFTAEKEVSAEWNSIFGYPIPIIMEIMKVTDATVYKGIQSFKFERWMVPDILLRDSFNSTNIRLILKKKDQTKFEYKYIVMSDSPHFATGEELNFILKYKRFFEGRWPFHGDSREPGISYCDFNKSEIIILGASSEIEDVWCSIDGTNYKTTAKSVSLPKSFRPLKEIAEDIRKDWRDIDSEAKYNLDAMASLTSVDEMYGNDKGRQIVNKFLWNSDNWKGVVADNIKAELKDIVGYNKVKCYFMKEDESSTARFVTDKVDFSKLSWNEKEAVIFSHEEADIILKNKEWPEFECCVLDPNDEETIKMEIENIIADVSINYDDEEDNEVDEETINRYTDCYKDIVAYLIGKCDGTYGDYMKKIRAFCDFSEFQ